MQRRELYVTNVAGASIFVTIQGPFRTVELFLRRLTIWREQIARDFVWLLGVPADESSDDVPAS